MAFILRWVNLVLIFVFFLLAFIATVPVPLYSYNLNKAFQQSGTVGVTLWSIRTSEVSIYVPNTVPEQSTKVPAIEEVRINYLNCTEQRSRFRAMQGFSIAGTVCGFYAFAICFLMCALKLKVKLALFLFLFASFLSEFFLVIVGAVTFTKSACEGKENKLHSFKEMGFSIGTAFVLQLIACLGYLVCLIITPFTQELWCGKG